MTRPTIPPKPVPPVVSPITPRVLDEREEARWMVLLFTWTSSGYLEGLQRDYGAWCDAYEKHLRASTNTDPRFVTGASRDLAEFLSYARMTGKAADAVARGKMHRAFEALRSLRELPSVVFGRKYDGGRALESLGYREASPYEPPFTFLDRATERLRRLLPVADAAWTYEAADLILDRGWRSGFAPDPAPTATPPLDAPKMAEVIRSSDPVPRSGIYRPLDAAGALQYLAKGERAPQANVAVERKEYQVSKRVEILEDRQPSSWRLVWVDSRS